MDKHYTTISVCATSLEGAVLELISYTVTHNGELACYSFNGVMLYSDTVSLESVCKQVTNMTYKQHKNRMEQVCANDEKEEKEYKNKIPGLTKIWIEKGHKILSNDRWELWDEIVPIRLAELYHGEELGWCLSIVKMLNNGCTFAEAKAEVENQAHTGTTLKLVSAMIKLFCDRGNAFIKYYNN